MRYDGKRVRFTSLIIASFLCLTLGKGYAQQVVGQITASTSSEGVSFSYAGDTGPEFWGSLLPEWETCGMGMAQSPIDISSMEITASAPADLQFNYNPTSFIILNNGHTIEVPYASGSSLVVGDDTFEVKQFHFHTPSEHTIEQGAHYPIEMHIVHQSSQGNLAVVAVMIRPGAAHPALDAIELFSQLIPLEAGLTYTFNDLSINVGDLLPTARQYVHYPGSLTTPPCTEDVDWYVLQTPIEMSAEQIGLLRGALGLLNFASLLDTNNRPTQPLNERTLSQGGQ